MQEKYELTLEENVFLAKKMLVNNIYSNAKIEGCNVTFPETETILNGVNVPNLKLDDIQCILNLRDAWKYVIATIEKDFNLAYISKINEQVARNESLQWGVLRTGKVLISGTEYVPEIPKEEEVNAKLEEILAIKNITNRAIKYMLYGMRSQLFWDGNKRTSMICANKILIQNGKGILMVQDKDLKEFSQLLTDYYTTNQSEKIEEFLWNHCIFGIDK
ncbi:MAG: Fic family protein [Clostridia bacterium]|nr:Fic family protein [Clostridia bacterium]